MTINRVKQRTKRCICMLNEHYYFSLSAFFSQVSADDRVLLTFHRMNAFLSLEKLTALISMTWKKA